MTVYVEGMDNGHVKSGHLMERKGVGDQGHAVAAYLLVLGPCNLVVPDAQQYHSGFLEVAVSSLITVRIRRHELRRCKVQKPCPGMFVLLVRGSSEKTKSRRHETFRCRMVHTSKSILTNFLGSVA
jgi:hypothetical protein